jgi:hypothetical protein
MRRPRRNPHVDRLSAAHYVKQITHASTAIGERAGALQAIWKNICNWPDLATGGSQWDHLFADGQPLLSQIPP